jgi:anti-anti-sigma factor
MEFQLERRQEQLFASGDMTIYQADGMKTAFLGGWVRDVSDVTLDLANVTELDTCGLQILLAVRQLAQAEGRRLTLAHPSPAVQEVFGLCCLSTSSFTGPEAV